MKLYPYQEEGVEFLLSAPRRYLGDRMGLGKTVQAAVAAARASFDRALVLTRAAAVENWRREWKVWGPPGSLLAVKSYASPQLHGGDIQGGDYDVVILDEAHYVKNREARRTLAALTVARQAPRSWLLSGSPSPNYDPRELWAPIRALWPGVPEALGIDSYEAWRDFFCRGFFTRYGWKTIGVRNADTLKQVLGTIMLRRSAEDVAGDLPPFRPDVHLLPRDPGMERVIQGIKSRDRDGEWGAVYRRVTGEYKAPRIADIIEQELADGEYRKIVLMAYHQNVLDLLESRLSRFGLVRLDGRTRDRQGVVDSFTDDAGVRVFLGQQVAAGEAINLQVAREVALVEPSHNPEENAQAIARIRPHLQGNRVRARVFAVAGSQDEQVMDNIAAKLRNRKELGL